MDENTLIERAKAALSHSYSPYSGLRVGAAVLTSSGEIFTGTNVENASYGLTICAERVAIFGAVAAGHTSVEAIAIVSDSRKRFMPCGACLQVMSEFGVKKVIVATVSGNPETYRLDELLPKPFRLE